MNQIVSYFKDVRSGVVIRFEGLWDKNEMMKNPEYAEVDEKAFLEYQKKQKAIDTKE